MNIYLVTVSRHFRYVCYADSKQEALDLYDGEVSTDQITVEHLGYSQFEGRNEIILFKSMGKR